MSKVYALVVCAGAAVTMLALPLASTTLAASFSVNREADVKDNPRLEGVQPWQIDWGAQLLSDYERIIELDSLVVEEGESLDIHEDTLYIVHGPVRIKGEVNTYRAGDTRNGASIAILSSDWIRIDGRITVSDGYSATLPGQAGGDGGSICLGAPVIGVAQQTLSGGEGGSAEEIGHGGNGGNGGSVILFGDVIRFGHSDEVDYVTAKGGDGGAPGKGVSDSMCFAAGGDGGNGGNAGFMSVDSCSLLSHLIESARFDLSRNDGEDGDWDWVVEDGANGRDGEDCFWGFDGFSGNDAFAGHGEPGADGDNAEILPGPGPVGAIDPATPGGKGGDGGWALASNGGRGGHGGDCCDPSGPGGDGGAGGDGGTAHAGKGAKGGKGGDGIFGITPGARGGDGGNGGEAGGGHSGDGGNAGWGLPVGTEGIFGSMGFGNPGSGGVGGAPGAFAPFGSYGDPGNAGTGDDGDLGWIGESGLPC